jgi:uncharacterized protein YndB with AHSA1/START domain
MRRGTMSTDLGEITNCYTITFTRRSKHSASRMWKAITEPDEVAAWTEADAEIDLRVGGTYTLFAGTESAEECVIVRVEPERVLTIVWGMNRPDAWGDLISVVQWEIQDDGDGCTFTFVHNGCADRGEGEAGLAAGWHGFFDQLDKHLDGETWSTDEARADWERLHAPYDERLNAVLVR